ncbi:MAG: molybdate ABC transporter substrate-binding protein, partial [Candidatus Sulfotelmatobacter sp.]
MNDAAEPGKGHGYSATRQVSKGQREQAIKNPHKFELRTIPGIRSTISIVFSDSLLLRLLPDMSSMTKCRLLSISLIAFLAMASVVLIPQAESAEREINVAAAADLSSALQEIAANYEKRTGVVVKLSFGASGALTQQIQNGAPFDVFFSADMDYPRQLIAGGQADGATLYRYAVGQLVLWVP